MNASALQTIVALFVRCPVPGRVKTRLARELGDISACDLYRAMVADAIANVRESGLPLLLFHDGQGEGLLPRAWTTAATRVIPQEGESLGERMCAAFGHSFSAGAGGVILAGSDIPGIDGGLIRSASEAIAVHDVVFAPALDGGYCLVAAGKERFDGRVFRDIPWSTPGVLDTTLTVCRELGLTCHLLEPRRDIDTLDDLAAYCRNPAVSAPVTNTWLAARGLLPAA